MISVDTRKKVGTENIDPGIKGGIVYRPADVRLGGVVIHDFGFFQIENLVQLLTADIQKVKFCFLGDVPRVPGTQIVDDDYIVSRREVGICYMRAYKARPPCDEDLHTVKTIASPQPVVKAVRGQRCATSGARPSSPHCY